MYYICIVKHLKNMTMIYKSRTQAKKETGLSYLGSVNMTSKHKKGFNYKELNYSLYLSPADSSGYEVCPGRTEECTRLCLNESGKNTMPQKVKGDIINTARIKKTRLFVEEREFFTRWIIDEIRAAKAKVDKLGYGFSVRINNTSDINPARLFIESNYQEHGTIGKNILEVFPDVQFYDYTKIISRINLSKLYPNYDITFSYTGYNLPECLDLLSKGVRVAMVFKEVPEEYMGYKVIDGDLFDGRFKDEKNDIVGLKFKRVRNKLETTDKFVIQ